MTAPITVAQLIEGCTNDIESIEVFSDTEGYMGECKSLETFSGAVQDALIKTWNYQNDDAKMFILIY